MTSTGTNIGFGEGARSSSKWVQEFNSKNDF